MIPDSFIVLPLQGERGLCKSFNSLKKHLPLQQMKASLQKKGDELNQSDMLMQRASARI
jgi:hypothetical protein